MTDTTTATEFEVTLADLRREGVSPYAHNRLVRFIQGRGLSTEDECRSSCIRFRHDAPIPLITILESNGIADAFWALRCVPGVERDARLFAVWHARQVEHLMTDQRSKDALNVAERFANGEATEEELAAARAAAAAAAAAATWAAAAAAAAARAWAAAATGAATRAAAAADAATRAAQSQMFLRMCEGTAPWQTAANPPLSPSPT